MQLWMVQEVNQVRRRIANSQIRNQSDVGGTIGIPRISNPPKRLTTEFIRNERDERAADLLPDVRGRIVQPCDQGSRRLGALKRPQGHGRLATNDPGGI